MKSPYDHIARRHFLQRFGRWTGTLALGSWWLTACQSQADNPKFRERSESEVSGVVIAAQVLDISLAQWSLHRRFFGESLEKGWSFMSRMLKEDPAQLLAGTSDPADFPRIAREEFDIEAIELVNTFYLAEVGKRNYWERFRDQCIDHDVRSPIIMCDSLGDLGDADPGRRRKAVENHYPWVEIAAFLGCHSIRVNAAGAGTPEKLAIQVVDGLRQLTNYAKERNVQVIVENHGGYSSDGQWLSRVIAQVDDPYCGTLPDFGNFCLEGTPQACTKAYDRYQGMRDLMPYAKGVSAKAYDFDENGEETTIDFYKMIQLVREAEYAGYVGIEYEGTRLSETDGIRATKNLLNQAFLYVTQ